MYLLFSFLCVLCPVLSFTKTTRLSSTLKMNDISRLLPSNQIQQSWLNGVGKPWSYGDLFELSASDKIQALSITSDGKNAIAIDTDHVTEVAASNLHVIKLFPENVDSLLQSLIANHVNVDIIDIPKNELFEFFGKVGEAFYNVGIYYFVITFVISILTRFGQNSGLGPGNLMSPLNNKNNLIDATTLNTTFADVAGCDEAKFELMEVVDFLKDKEKYEQAGAKIPKGVLLEGNPGTGKTLLARAVAGEAGVPFLSASGSEFIELYVGIGASRVRSLFEKAKENAPCVVFIDEIDAVGRKRGAGIAGGNDEREQTLNQILTNMDGFTTTDGIVVVAATNRIDVLDSALTRPGRFDRKVKVGLPDSIGRKRIFDVHFKNKKLANDYNLDELVSLTPGFSGADIANLANEAAIYSVRANNTQITQQNILDAYEKITIGIPSTTNNPEDAEVDLVAYHEIGHAFMVSLFNDIFDLRKITIKENKNGAGGYTLFTPKERFQKYATKRSVLANLIIALGGRAAEVYLYRKKNEKVDYDSYIFDNFKDLDITTGAVGDLKQANELARKYITEYGFGDNLCYNKNTNENMPFLGGDMSNQGNKISDIKKCDIDTQAEYLIDFAYRKALELIYSNADIFESLVTLLKTDKIIQGKQVYDLVEKIKNKPNDI